jgi:hypothetical protein
MFDHELEVSVRARRMACVIDPALALASPHGAQFAMRLAHAVEVWMLRTFWQVLDASDYYRSDPLSFWPANARARIGESGAGAMRQALACWEAQRAAVDQGNDRLHWLTDSLAESTFPEGAPTDLLERYEALHDGLAARSDPREEATESAAFFGAIDALALAGALGTARILTLAPDDPRGCLFAAAGHLLLDAEAAPLDDGELVALERAHLRGALIRAGAVPLLWCGLRAAVMHVVVTPNAAATVSTLRYAHADAADDRHSDADPDACNGDPPARTAGDSWSGARTFWYAL